MQMQLSTNCALHMGKLLGRLRASPHTRAARSRLPWPPLGSATPVTHGTCPAGSKGIRNSHPLQPPSILIPEPILVVGRADLQRILELKDSPGLWSMHLDGIPEQRLVLAALVRCFSVESRAEETRPNCPHALSPVWDRTGMRDAFCSGQCQDSPSQAQAVSQGPRPHQQQPENVKPSGPTEHG